MKPLDLLKEQHLLKLNLRNLLLFYIEACIIQSIISKAHLNNLLKKSLSLFPSPKVLFMFILDSKKKFLLLDLDETLIHSIFTH